jgi:hypothetical protein
LRRYKEELQEALKEANKAKQTYDKMVHVFNDGVRALKKN